MNPSSYPVRDLKVLAILGALVLTLLMTAPIALIGYLSKEVARKHACDARSVLDAGCQPGRLWKWINAFDMAAEQSLQGETGDQCSDVNGLRCKPGYECLGQTTTTFGVCQPLEEPVATGTHS